METAEFKHRLARLGERGQPLGTLTGMTHDGAGGRARAQIAPAL